MSKVMNNPPESLIQIPREIEYNSVSEWYPSDSQDAFDGNKEYYESRYNRPFPWDKQSITYRINSHGFRGEDFEATQDESFIALGCSMTFGVGVKEEQTWVRQLSEKLGIRGYNLGAPAKGYESCFRLLRYWLPILKSKTVFVFIPPGVRREWFNTNSHPPSYNTIGVWDHDSGVYTDAQFEMLMNEKESIIAKDRALYAIKGFCQEHGVTVHMIESDIYSSTPDDISRDIRHPGPIFNERLAEMFASFYGD